MDRRDFTGNSWISETTTEQEITLSSIYNEGVGVVYIGPKAKLEATSLPDGFMANPNLSLHLGGLSLPVGVLVSFQGRLCLPVVVSVSLGGGGSLSLPPERGLRGRP